jgi:catalase-peroxidase
VLHGSPGRWSNDFFVNLLDMSHRVASGEPADYMFEGATGRPASCEVDRHARSTWCSARNAELRAIAEVYASQGGQQKMIEDFVAAWTKVMTLDRFDLKRS